jgi:hypothetical protein
MIASVSWWDLTGSDQTIESLRRYLAHEGVQPWEAVRGLRLKFWMADPERNLWGAVMLWETGADLSQPLPPHRAVELIGRPPAVRHRFEVEATVEGLHETAVLAGLGSAFEKEGSPA